MGTEAYYGGRTRTVVIGSLPSVLFLPLPPPAPTPPPSARTPEISTWTPDPRLAHIPAIETTGLDWAERYPVIESHWDVLGVFPPSVIDVTEDHIISTGVGQAIPFSLDADNDFLRWNDIRQRKTFQIEIIDTTTGTSALSITVTTSPSLFLEELFAAAAGSGATLNRWWIPGETHPGYLYLEGETASAGGAAGEVHAYVMEFRKIQDRDRGKVDYQKIDPVTSAAPLRGRRFLSESSVLDTDAIADRLVNSHDTLCAPPPNATTYAYNHDYVVTREHIDLGLLHARNGSQAFLLLDEETQRQCFRQAYLFEIIPGTPPTTTQALRDTLPPNMRYAKSQYDLVWAEEFEDTTIPDLYDQGYIIDIRNGVSSDRPKQYESYPFAQTAVTYDDPIRIENGKFYLGYGLVPKNNDSDCDPESAGVRIFDFVDNCAPGATVNNIYVPVEYKYGYLEIAFARAPFISHIPFIWLNSHAGNLVGNKDGRSSLFHDRLSPAVTNTHLRNVYNCLIRNDANKQTYCIGAAGFIDVADFFRWETQFYGSELQLMEVIPENMYYSSNKLRGLFWTVNHYGDSYATSGNARFYYSFGNDINPDHQYNAIGAAMLGNNQYNARHNSFPFGSPFTYGIEWTPEGYIIWVKHGTRGASSNTADWSKISSSTYTPQGNGVSHQCEDATEIAGDPDTIMDGSRTIEGIVPCGINHVPLHLTLQGVAPPVIDTASLTNYYRDYNNNRALASSLGLYVEDRFVEIEHIRLYKPQNNYSDITPVYQ